MAKIPEGAIGIREEDVPAVESMQRGSEATFDFNIPEGAIGVREDGSYHPIDRSSKLQEEMQHQPFAPGITDAQWEELKDRAPAAAGGILFGIASGGMGFLPAAGMTFLGGASGEGLKDLYNYFYEPKKAPKTTLERITSMASAGGEEMLYEMGGRAILMTGGKAYRIIRPQLKGGMEGMNEMFSKHGGRYTMFQQTESKLVNQLDSLTRGSMTGKPVMEIADELNDVALNRWRKDLSGQIASEARQQLSPSDFGQFIFNTLEDGKAAFKSYTSRLYGSLDDLVKTEHRMMLRGKEMPSSIVDERGRALVEQGADVIVEEIRPVNVVPLKQAAAELRERLEKSANLALSDFGGDTINKIMNLDDALSFSVAQDARSTMLDLMRAAESTPGDAKLAGSLKNFANIISEQMDDAAKKQGTETFLKYQAIKREAEEGYKAFNDQFIWNFMNDKVAIEKFSQELFKPGNSGLITKFRRALNQAAKNPPVKGRRSINPKEVMDQVKQNYLEDLLDQTTKPVDIRPSETVDAYMQRAGVPRGENLKTFFSENPKIATMQKLFSKREQQALLDFTNAVQTTQEVNPAGMSMVMQLGQGGVFVRMLTKGAGAMREAATLFFGTEAMARLMTSEAGLKLLTSASKTSPYTREGVKIATKLTILLNNAERAEQGRDSLGEDVGNYLKDAGVDFKDFALESVGLDRMVDQFTSQQED